MEGIDTCPKCRGKGAYLTDDWSWIDCEVCDGRGVRDKCKCCGSTNLIHVEYGYTHPERYDGVSEIRCQACAKRFGRWSGKELKDGEFEKRFRGWR